MKIYDTHSDILFNLYKRTIEGETHVFEKYHLATLQKGNVVGGIWVVYSDSDFDIQYAYDVALECFSPYQEQYDVLYGLEGLRNIHTIEELDQLYQKGVRHASLTWNEANAFATGVKAEPTRGLQPLGKKAIQYMNEHHMVVDVSHLNIKSFYEVLEENPKILFASHSNAYAISDHIRNLNDDQLIKLRQLNGYIGVNSARNFVSKCPNKQNIEGLIDQIVYLGNFVGLDHVMLGLDMMDFLSDYDNANLDDLKSHADANKIAQQLSKRGFTKTEIEMICSKNYLKAIQNVKK